MTPVDADSTAVHGAAGCATRARIRTPFIGLLGLAALHAYGQTESAPAARALAIVPSVTLSQTLTDNALLSADKKSELITQVSPAVSVRSSSGRVQGFVDYALTGAVYARRTQADTVQQSLNAAVRAEAIENFAFVDAQASISRQNISALGTPSPDSALQTNNQTEVRSFSLSPYVRGQLGGLAEYQARLNYAGTRTDSNLVGSSTNSGGSLHLGSAQTSWLVNWALDASRQVSDFSEGRKTTSDSAVAALIITPYSGLQFSLRGGREANDILTLERESHTTYGAGMRWTPSPRTTVSLDADERYFGRSHAFSLQHRTAQTLWTFSDTRSASTDAGAAARAPVFTEFDLLFLQLTSRYADPLERARQALIELQRLGKNPFAIAPGGFLSNAVSLQRAQNLSFAYLGLRTTLVVSALQSESSRLDPFSTAVDSLSGGGSVRQRSLSASVSHRLTPQSSANLNVSRSRSTDLATGTDVDLLSLTAGWSCQLGARTQVSLGARRAISGGDLASYNESAVFATLSMQF